MKVCQRCVMDEKIPGITFDDQGFCNYCTDAINMMDKIIKHSSELEKLFIRIKNTRRRSNEYDAAIGVSGGIDSSYAAYLAYQHGLKVLLIHFDNGYNTTEGNNNVDTIVNHTGWDLEYRTMDFNEFRDLQLAYLKAGVMNIEALSDHSIRSTTYQIALEKDIKYLIKGNNWASESIMPLMGHRHTDLVNIKSIHKAYGTMPLKTFPHRGYIHYAFLLSTGRIKEARPLNYINYVRDSAKEMLMKEWGWKDYGGKHFESIITRFYQAYILPTRWGYDKRKSHLSALICSNQMTREEALNILKEPPYPSRMFEKDFLYILQRLELTNEEFNRLMNIPKRSHTEFATNDNAMKLVKFIKWLVKPFRSSFYEG